MSAAGNPDNAALTAGRLLAATGGLLLVAGTVYVGTFNEGSVESWPFLAAIAAACGLVLVALVAVVSGRLSADLLTLAATGWALAWNGVQLNGWFNLSVSPVTTRANGPFLERIYAPIDTPWYFWALDGVALALGLAALLIIGGIAARARDVSGTATEVLLTQVSAPGWHPDPAGTPGLARWWNGTLWTSDTRRVA